MSDKPGRNDLCYCGSGKKYKNCHLAADRAIEDEARSLGQAAQFLRRDLLLFGRHEQFHQAFAAALPLYWNNYYQLDNAEEMDQEESLLFFDWFAFDYQMDDQSRLIEHYREQKWGDLSSHQQNLLAGWLTAAPAGGYILLGYDGQTLTLRDFLTQEIYQVYEPAGHGAISMGDMVLGRLLPVQDHLEFSVSVAYIPQAEIGDLAEKLAAAQASNPQTSPAQFLRRHNHLFVHHALAQAEAKGRPPVARLNPNRPDKLKQKIVRRLKPR